MKRCSQCDSDKPESDFYVRKNLKSGLSCWCKECSRKKQVETQRRWNERNPTANRDAMRVRRNDPLFVEKERGIWRENYHADPEKFKAKSARWKAANPEKHKQKRADWWSKNPGTRNASRMRRYAAKLQATPAWANNAYIKLWYAFAKSESERTGKAVEVDHIVPLQSETVCGLHNEHNLQLLFERDNRVKNNRVWPDMP